MNLFPQKFYIQKSPHYDKVEEKFWISLWFLGFLFLIHLHKSLTWQNVRKVKRCEYFGQHFPILSRCNRKQLPPVKKTCYHGTMLPPPCIAMTYQFLTTPVFFMLSKKVQIWSLWTTTVFSPILLHIWLLLAFFQLWFSCCHPHKY